MVGFKITDHKGFHITFKNKVTVSVQFGPGNYCENREMDFGKQKELETLKSSSAEIAIFIDKSDVWLTRYCPVIKGSEDVEGWASPETVLEILKWAENLDKDDIKTLTEAYNKLED